jgi:class 3 adenylate cyclase
VSKEVAEAIWREREQFAHGGRPAPRSLTVTALFTDLTGFTTVSENLTPEALMDWLNEYMDVMAQEISRHDGCDSASTRVTRSSLSSASRCREALRRRSLGMRPAPCAAPSAWSRGCSS